MPWPPECRPSCSGPPRAGLASRWATGDWMADLDVKAFAGLGPDDQLVALVYLGWPCGEVAAVERPEAPSSPASQGRGRT